MSFLNKAKSMLAKNADKAPGVIDKVANVANSRTGRKHSSKIDKASRKAKDYVAKMDKSTAGTGTGTTGTTGTGTGTAAGTTGRGNP